MNHATVPAPLDIAATVFTKLPDALNHRGEPNEWMRATRPGQRLHSFIEGPCFDARGDLRLVDVPYGRVFRVSPDGPGPWRINTMANRTAWPYWPIRVPWC